MPENRKVFKGPDQDCGLSLPESFASYSPDTCLWRTSQGSLFEEWMPYLESWPRSGTMRNGSVYRQQLSAPRTSETGCGYWPTPSASRARSEGMIGQMRAKVDAGKISKEEAEAMIGGSLTPARMSYWPTPSSVGPNGGPTGLAGGAGNRKKLYDMLGEEEGKKLGCASLNPNWVEWLMGFPLGWTDLEDSETP